MKKVIGILSIVLFFIIGFQSCAAGLGNALTSSGEVSGSAGFILALFMLIGGIIVLVSKNSKGMVITSIVFYVLGALLGFANAGTFTDLKIWSALNIIFAVLLIFHLSKNKELYLKK